MGKELLTLLKEMKAEEADVKKIFDTKDDGVRISSFRDNPKYSEKFDAFSDLMAEAMAGSQRAFYRLREAMTTSDFPYLFGDVLDRMLLGTYMETPAVYRNYCKISSVPDFRTVKRFTVDGAESVLGEVQQQEEYPASKLTEGKYEFSVKKYGRVMPFAWETIVNDDLGSFRDIPARFGRAARRTEQKFATQLYCDASGPHASFYTGGNSNIVTSNPALSINALQTAMTVLSKQKDADGEPIAIDMIHLVVPPALEVTAQNILNAMQLELNEAGGSTNTKLIAVNWMKNRFRLHVDYYIPIVASTANGDTSWWLFASPAAGRPALEIGFLRGHESPRIFIKSPNAMAVGGGQADAMGGDFDTDSIQYKVRHVLGGTREDPKMTVASNGSGS